MLHIGLRIKALMNERNIDVPALAKKLNKTKQAVYIMLDKEDINTLILRELSCIFNVPLTYFLEEDVEVQNKSKKNVELLNEQHPQKEDASQPVLSVNEELIRLRAENDVLREIVGIHKKKGTIRVVE